MSGAPDRSGTPWPLIQHLASAAALLEQGARLAPLADKPNFPWATQPEQAALDLSQRVASAPPVEMALALRREAARRLTDMSRGLRRYQVSDERRTLEDPPTLFRFGASRVLDYGPETGAPVLVAPSLVNRFHILDLDEGCSLLRHLSAVGLRPLLLDWGVLDAETRGFSLTDYVERRLLPAFDRVAAETGKQVSVLGYCLGGAMATALSALRADKVRRLALIGAPWDFSAMEPMRAALASLGVAADRRSMTTLLASLETTYGAVPVLALQSVFAQLDPGLALAKFRRFADLPEGSIEARRFVLLEDWLNDGPPLAAPSAREALIHWQLDNATMQGAWRVAGHPIDPRNVRAPTLIAAARRDRITPEAAATPLASLIPDARLIRPHAGHVGMIAGRDAMNQLWTPLTDFLLQ